MQMDLLCGLFTTSRVTEFQIHIPQIHIPPNSHYPNADVFMGNEILDLES